MKNLVVTEVDLPVKLQRFGIFHYLESEDVQFYILDWCYAEQLESGDLSKSDISLAKVLVKQGKVKLVSLSPIQMDKLPKLREGCCSMFLARTTATVLYAKSMGYTLVSEDNRLRVVSHQQLGISISHYESIAVGLLQDMISRGIDLKIELVHELI